MDPAHQLGNCFICSSSRPKESLVSRQAPVYVQSSDGVKAEVKALCEECSRALDSIQAYCQRVLLSYKRQNQSTYCNYYYKCEAVEQLPSVEVEAKANQLVKHASELQTNREKRSNSESNSFNGHNFQKRHPHDLDHRTKNAKDPDPQARAVSYSQFVQEEIKKSNLNYLNNLPKTLQYMVHVSSKGKGKSPSKKPSPSKMGVNFVTAEERHLKIKNILGYMVEKLSVSLGDLPFVSILVNSLLCEMDSKHVLSIVTELSHIILRDVEEVVTWRALALCNNREPHDRMSIKVDRVWPQVKFLLQMKGQTEEGLSFAFRKALEIGEGSCNYEERLRQLEKSCCQDNDNNNTKQSLKHGRDSADLQTLYLLKSQRNNFAYVLTTFMAEEESHFKHFQSIQTRYKKEKEQYISRIVKLSNQIQDLETLLRLHPKPHTHPTRSQATEEVQLHESQLTDNQADSQMEQFDNNAIEERSEAAEEESPNAFSALSYMQSIATLAGLTDPDRINALEKKVSKKPSPGVLPLTHSPQATNILGEKDPEKMCTAIITEINKTQDLLEKLVGKNREIEAEKARLLDILSKKEDRFISLIHEKDIIIERYENALWKMENGLEVTEEPLSHRIKYIIQKINSLNEETKSQAFEEVLLELPKKSSSKKKKVNSSSFVLPAEQASELLSPAKKDKEKCEIY